MSLPADSFDIPDPTELPEPIPMSERSDSEKIELMRQQIEWLCAQVQGLLSAAMQNPMARMMMKKGGM